jgi:segregation and condensation protein A
MPPDAGTVAPAAGDAPVFDVHLDNFSGPFDLLLSLIAKHELDITEVALARVTDEFIDYISAQAEWDLSRASDFLVVAATLLDLKAASLLPGEERDGEDLELLETRDLLFARLLQYKAFKEVAALFGQRMDEQAAFYPRAVPLEEPFAALLPELVWQLGPQELAAIAAAVFARPPKASNALPLEHLHAARVSVPEQTRLLASRLENEHTLTFRAIVADAQGATHVIVARFLALLELFRTGAVSFDQVAPMAELTIRWTGATSADAVAAGTTGSAATPSTMTPGETYE